MKNMTIRAGLMVAMVAVGGFAFANDASTSNSTGGVSQDQTYMKASGAEASADKAPAQAKTKKAHGKMKTKKTTTTTETETTNAQ